MALSSVLVPLMPSIAYADAATYLGGINSQYYGGIFLRDCLAQMGDYKKKILGSAASSPGQVFGSYVLTYAGTVAMTPNTSSAIGRTFSPDSGVSQCNDAGKVTAALSAFTNLKSPTDYLNRIGYTAYNRTVTLTGSGGDCNSNVSNISCSKQVQTTYYEISGNDKANDLIPTQIDAAKFYALQTVFNTSCTLSASVTGKGVAVTQKQIILDSSGKYVVNDVPMEFPPLTYTSNSSTGETTTDAKGNADKQITNYDYVKSGSCNQILDALNGLASTVAAWDNKNTDNAVVTAQVGGKGEGGGATDEASCTAAGGTWDSATSSCSTDKNSATCSGGALGWLLCPLMNLATDAMQNLAGAIGGFMQFQPLIGSDAGKSIQTVWQVTVVPANLILVIAFLVVIFSQATSIGLSAYGIKKMLPRVIAAAILINLSFFLCALLVDAFNIAGATVGSIMQSAGNALPTSGGSISGYSTLAYDQAVASIIGLLAVGTTVAAVTGGIAFIVPIALSGLLSFLVIFLVLAVRHIVAIFLIIAAPLAFAAMVLPNTEGLFKKWWKMLVVTLALYPVIMALSYGSLLASKIILLTGPSGNDGVNSWQGLVTTGVAFVSLFAWIFGLKFIMSWGAGALGKVAGMVNDRSKGIIDRSKKWAGEKKQNARFQQARQWNKAYRDANRVSRFGRTDGFQGALNKMNSYAGGVGVGMPNKWGENAGSYLRSATNKAAAYDNKIFKEDEENAAAEFARNGIQGPLMVAHARTGRVARYKRDENGNLTNELEYGRKLTEAEHAAAINWTMSQGKLEERMALYGSDWASEERNPGNRRALDALSSGYFQKDVARFGNTYGGKLGAGKAGGDISVSNAVLANMAQGKTAAEALLDNDMAQRVADVGSMSNADLIAHINADDQLKALADSKGGAAKLVASFRLNAKEVTDKIYNTPDLNSRIKPEYAEALRELNSDAYNAGRTTRATGENAERVAAAAKLANNQSQDTITIDPNFSAIGQQK